MGEENWDSKQPPRKLTPGGGITVEWGIMLLLIDDKDDRTTGPGTVFSTLYIQCLFHVYHGPMK